MSQQYNAIYENGVFRPLTPVSLPERTEVQIVVQQGTVDESPEVIEKQRAALEELFRKVDALSKHENNDGWSAKDHDEVLYGWKK